MTQHEPTYRNSAIHHAVATERNVDLAGRMSRERPCGGCAWCFASAYALITNNNLTGFRESADNGGRET